MHNFPEKIRIRIRSKYLIFFYSYTHFFYSISSASQLTSPWAVYEMGDTSQNEWESDNLSEHPEDHQELVEDELPPLVQEVEREYILLSKMPLKTEKE